MEIDFKYYEIILLFKGKLLSEIDIVLFNKKIY